MRSFHNWVKRFSAVSLLAVGLSVPATATTRTETLTAPAKTFSIGTTTATINGGFAYLTYNLYPTNILVTYGSGVRWGVNPNVKAVKLITNLTLTGVFANASVSLGDSPGFKVVLGVGSVSLRSSANCTPSAGACSTRVKDVRVSGAGTFQKATLRQCATFTYQNGSTNQVCTDKGLWLPAHF